MNEAQYLSLKMMDKIIDETQAVFDTYMKKYGMFSNMTRSVYVSLCEQHRIYSLLKEKFEEEANNEF